MQALESNLRSKLTNKHEFIMKTIGYADKFFELVQDPILMETIFFSKLYFYKSKEREKEENLLLRELKALYKENPEKQNLKEELKLSNSIKSLFINIEKEKLNKIFFVIEKEEMDSKKNCNSNSNNISKSYKSSKSNSGVNCTLLKNSNKLKNKGCYLKVIKEEDKEEDSCSSNGSNGEKGGIENNSICSKSLDNNICNTSINHNNNNIDEENKIIDSQESRINADINTNSYGKRVTLTNTDTEATNDTTSTNSIITDKNDKLTNNANSTKSNCPESSKNTKQNSKCEKFMDYVMNRSTKTPKQTIESKKSKKKYFKGDNINICYYYTNDSKSNSTSSSKDEKEKRMEIDNKSIISKLSLNSEKSDNSLIDNSTNDLLTTSKKQHKHRRIFKKQFKVLSVIDNHDKKQIHYFITETHLINNNNTNNNNNSNITNKLYKQKPSSLPQTKLIQYELIYKIYKVEGYRVLLKIDIIFHPLIKILPLFHKKINLKIVYKIENELKKEKYGQKISSETILINTSRKMVMNNITNLGNITELNSMFSKKKNSSENLDRIGDKWSLFFANNSVKLDFVVTNYFESQDTDKDWIRESYLYNSNPETIKFMLKAILKEITPNLTLYNCVHEFEVPIASDILYKFLQDKKIFLKALKKTCEAKKSEYKENKENQENNDNKESSEYKEDKSEELNNKECIYNTDKTNKEFCTKYNDKDNIESINNVNMDINKENENISYINSNNNEYKENYNYEDYYLNSKSGQKDTKKSNNDNSDTNNSNNKNNEYGK